MDEHLLQEFKSAERAAFEKVVRLYQHRIFSFLYWLCGDREAAQDLCQETFFRAYQRRGQVRQAKGFTTWLYRIASNLYRDSRRRQRITVAPLDGETARPEEGPASALTVEVRRALSALPAPYREAVAMKYLEQATYDDIAKSLGISKGNAKARVHRAKKMLYDQLSPILAQGARPQG